MRRSVAGIVILFGLCAAPCRAIDERLRIYIDRMSGFEEVLATVAAEEGVPGTLLDLPDMPHFRISQAPRFRSLAERKFYYISTGRTDDMVLDFWNARTKQSVVIYYFRMSPDVKGQRRVAREFLREVRRKLR